MPQEGPVHGGADGVGGVAGEQHVAAVVAGVEGVQDEGRVVGAVAVRLDGAELCARRRAGDGQARLLGRRHDLRARRVGAGGCRAAGQQRESGRA